MVNEKRKSKRKGIWIPLSILKLNGINGNDKILLSEIYSLCEKENGCYASNHHFATLLGYETDGAASKRITILEELELIRTEKVYKKKRCIGRFIFKINKPNNSVDEEKNIIESSDKWKQLVVPNGFDSSSNKNTINTVSINSKNINSNTRTSILGKTKIHQKELPPHLKPITTTQGAYLKNELKETSDFLVGATKLGAEIFEFDSESKFKELEKVIGNEELEIIKPTLKKFISAKNRLNS
jgi:hypothetical protein